MSCCGSYNGCHNVLVPKRLTDISVTQLVLGDGNGNAIVDISNVAISLGIQRNGSTTAFEFERQQPAITPLS